jgi:hypothetical protein
MAILRHTPISCYCLWTNCPFITHSRSIFNNNWACNGEYGGSDDCLVALLSHMARSQTTGRGKDCTTGGGDMCWELFYLKLAPEGVSCAIICQEMVEGVMCREWGYQESCNRIFLRLALAVGGLPNSFGGVAHNTPRW